MHEPCAERDRRRVLVLERREDIRQFLCTLLYLTGYDVEVTGDTDGALMAMWRGGHSVVIMADAMRRANGGRMLAVSRTISPHVPVVILSEILPDAGEWRDIRRDVYAWMRTPFDCIRFLQVVRNAAEIAVEGRAGPSRPLPECEERM